MLIREPFVIAPDIANDGVRARALGTFGFIIRQAATKAISIGLIISAER